MVEIINLKTAVLGKTLFYYGGANHPDSSSRGNVPFTRS